MRLRQLVPQARDLIERCLRGDRRAQRLFCEGHAPQMLAVCQRYLRNLEDAEEVLQNALLKALDKLAELENRDRPEPWLKRIAAREALNFIRQKRNVFVELDESSEEIATGETDFPKGFEAEELMRLIRALPMGYRVVFNLYAIEGYEHQEIAELLGIDPATSRSQLHKARKQLQSQIQNRMLHIR